MTLRAHSLKRDHCLTTASAANMRFNYSAQVSCKVPKEGQQQKQGIVFTGVVYAIAAVQLMQQDFATSLPHQLVCTIQYADNELDKVNLRY